MRYFIGAKVRQIEVYHVLPSIAYRYDILHNFNMTTLPIFRACNFPTRKFTMTQHIVISSPIGNIRIEGSEQGISRIQLLIEEAVAGMDPIPDCLADAVAQLHEYFDGTRKEFDLKLDFGQAPAFHQEVWKMVKLIPYGRTRTYADIAEIIDHHNAFRAVGHANGMNPLPIVIPCHRVIGKDGSLTGYYYGLEIKRWLLSHESPGQYMKQGDLVEVLQAS